ncbi:MGDG synthase family glycosyltransferase [Sporomusa malonica]|uniref:UDP-N-acetylglucosamine:LPS N-acetylglucosamine transferase n=1 Tax=Sporomusa malonica TaxID=112901 RepID=A0A1W2CYF0_9FIRM|nr:glycosyltransferase [Sporomusa malonica]SMC89966.1 UDP-N-acetylglucosamine:LPS N-acetylglucosamine transferase [Sporomusa malonica]
MTSTVKNILFAISDTGGGHRSAAAAIVAALNGYDQINCTLSDLLKATGFPGLRKAPEIYDYCSRKQLWLNNLFFEKTNSVKRINLLTKFVYHQAAPQFEGEISQINPNLLLAVHPLVIGLLVASRKATRASWPIFAVVTDLATIHASWATPGADLYLVPTEEAYNALVRHGIAASQIILTGFPVHPKFSPAPATRIEARHDLGIDPERFSVLLTGGGVGAGNMTKWIKALVKNCHNKQILVVTGRNQALYNQLQILKSQFEHLHVYGFVDNMETLMTASDIIISKAGPGTIMEAVAMQRPLIITEAVGIQETGNIDFVVNNRLGHFCPDSTQGCQIINNHAAGGDFAFSYGKRPPSNGSIRIADMISRQLATSAAKWANIESHSTSLFRGA